MNQLKNENKRKLPFQILYITIAFQTNEKNDIKQKECYFDPINVDPFD